MIETTFSRSSATATRKEKGRRKKEGQEAGFDFFLLPFAFFLLEQGPLVPVDRLPQAVAERGGRRPPEPLPRPTRVQAPAGLAVGLGRVPPQLAAEPAQLADQLRQRLDRDLPAAAEVHRVRVGVPRGLGDHSVRRGAGVQELPRLPSGPPRGRASSIRSRPITPLS